MARKVAISFHLYELCGYTRNLRTSWYRYISFLLRIRDKTTSVIVLRNGILRFCLLKTYLRAQVSRVVHSTRGKRARDERISLAFAYNPALPFWYEPFFIIILSERDSSESSRGPLIKQARRDYRPSFIARHIPVFP